MWYCEICVCHKHTGDRTVHIDRWVQSTSLRNRPPFAQHILEVATTSSKGCLVTDFFIDQLIKTRFQTVAKWVICYENLRLSNKNQNSFKTYFPKLVIFDCASSSACAWMVASERTCILRERERTLRVRSQRTHHREWRRSFARSLITGSRRRWTATERAASRRCREGEGVNRLNKN